jgi:ATP-dependent helicase/nuclease subunit B
MRTLFTDHLKKISSKYFLEEKILICPSFEIGQQIILNYTRQAGQWINLKAETLHSLAAKIIEPVIAEKAVKAISSKEVLFLVDQLFSNLCKKGRLLYFKKHVKNSGIIHALAENILELKSWGIRFDQLQEAFFIHREKALDLSLLYQCYEQALRQKSFIDPADVIRLATENIKDSDKNKVFILSAKQFYPKNQRDFLKKLPLDRLEVIDEEEIPGIELPKNRLATSLSSATAKVTFSEMRYLFEPSKRPKKAVENDLSIELFCAEDARSEIHKILQILAFDHISLDDVQIIYSDEGAYLDLLYNLFNKIGLPAVFSSGLRGDRSRAGKCLKGFLLWIQDDFSEIGLRKLLKYGLLDRKGDPALTGDLWHLLRLSKIGWGRDRYQKILKKNMDQCRAQMEKEPQNESIQKRLDRLSFLNDWIQRLLEIVPPVHDGQIAFKDLCGCAKDLLKDFVKAKSEEEAGFLAGLLRSICSLEKMAEGKILLEEGIHKIHEIIKDEKFLKKGPRPGHLLVSSLTSGGNSGRRHTFIVGMDEHKFPGAQMQDPVLLDLEREKISADLPLSKDRLKQRLYDFTSMVSSLQGKVFFSYASYDIKDERNLFASSVLLQAYRLKSRKADADYHDLSTYMEKSGRVDSVYHFDDDSRWFGKIIEGDRFKDAEEAVLQIYPWLKEGLQAQRQRKSPRLTVYDGWIGADPGLDPRQNKDFILSCTAIEQYVQSPYAFFIRNILNIKRPEEMKRDNSFWLDAAQRGSLLHEVYDGFIKTLLAMGKIPDGDSQKRIIGKVLQDAIERYADEVPVPALSVFYREVATLERDIDVFIHVNKELENACFSELLFGYSGREPVKICLGNEDAIHIKGKIDRVDIDQQGHYHVWDYKTGSTYAYEQDAYVSGGRQFQHILYAKAFEGIVKDQSKETKVTKCGYIFPTERGRDAAKGFIFARDPLAAEKWQKPLQLLLDLMAGGLFMISDEEDPPYIDDEDLYGSKKEKQDMKLKISQSQDPLIEKWRLLREFK